MKCFRLLVAVIALLAGGATVLQASEPACGPSNEPACTASSLLPATCENPCCGAAEIDCGAANDPCCGCDACGGEGCDPLWTIRAGAIFLQRSRPNGPPVVDSNNGPLIVPDNFNLGTKPGFDLYARRRLASGRSLEVRYIEVDEYSAAADANTAGLVLSITGSIGVFGPTSTPTTYQAFFRSVEANLVGDNDSWWNPILGFRYFDVRDDLFVTLVENGNPNLTTYNINSQNHLYGAQLGFEGVLLRTERWTLDMWAKAGLYYNHTDRAAVLAIPMIGSFGNSIDEESAAFAGDMAFNASYRLTEHVALRGGYQLLWLAGIAEATSQTGALVPDPINIDGHPFYHGAMCSVEVSW